MRFNSHRLLNKLRAGRYQILPSFNLNNTKPTSTCWRQILHIAKRWNSNTIAVKSRKNGFAFASLNLPIIYFNIYVHTNCSFERLLKEYRGKLARSLTNATSNALLLNYKVRRTRCSNNCVSRTFLSASSTTSTFIYIYIECS